MSSALPRVWEVWLSAIKKTILYNINQLTMENCKCDISDIPCLQQCFQDGSFDDLMKECGCEDGDDECMLKCIGGECAMECLDCHEECHNEYPEDYDRCTDVCIDVCECFEPEPIPDPVRGSDTKVANRKMKSSSGAAGSLDSSKIVLPIFGGGCLVALAVAAVYVKKRRERIST
jgi:hypothetical protein